jgi:hypothetical protein
MKAHAVYMVVIITFALTAGAATAEPPKKLTVTAEMVRGEWQQITTRKKADDTMLVMTFRKNGICRLDAIDLVTGKMPEGPDVHLPGVGLWKIDGQDLIITWEQWSDGRNQPVQSENRFRVINLDEKELVYRLILPDRPNEKLEPNRWRPFEGWATRELLRNLFYKR